MGLDMFLGVAGSDCYRGESGQRLSAISSGGGAQFPLRHPHVKVMAQWQKSFEQPPKTKAELRAMLAEAVSNTRAEPKRPSMPKTMAATPTNSSTQIK
jgi:hypothetical protein